MNEYTIHCTKEQTEKAWELGAPLYHLDKMQSEGFDENPYKNDYRDKTKLSNGLYGFCPTAEQMIGWLEEQGFFFRLNTTSSSVEIDFNCIYENYGVTRKEATIAAIDLALDYLKGFKRMPFRLH